MEITTTAPIRLNARNLPFELIDTIAKFIGCVKLRNGVWCTQFPEDDPRREIASRHPTLYQVLPELRTPNSGRFLPYPNSQLSDVRYTLFPKGKYVRVFGDSTYGDVTLESNIYKELILYYKGETNPLHILMKCDGSAVEYGVEYI